MRILVCHNYYQQRGGEDESVDAEVRLLERHGHTVLRHARHNDEIGDMSTLRVAGKTVWSRRSGRALEALLRRERPDVMHATNTFPLVSPSILWAARRAGVPVVLAMRNYRFVCAAGTLRRDGRVCEDCLRRRVGWPGVVHRCYRGSAAGSVVLVGANAVHRTIGTWHRAVDLFFAPSRFARDKLVEAGFPGDRFTSKPNFIDPDPGVGSGGGGFLMFVGRLSQEKGLDVLLDAWARRRRDDGLRLKIVGDGPLEPLARAAADRDDTIDLLGRLDQRRVVELVGDAEALVMPSTWYETFGRTMIEAFSRGTPVLASDLGAMRELVDHGRTGFLFEMGDAAGLADAIGMLRRHPDPTALRLAARRQFERLYTGERNHEMLLGLYEQAIRNHRQRTADADR